MGERVVEPAEDAVDRGDYITACAITGVVRVVDAATDLFQLRDVAVEVARIDVALADEVVKETNGVADVFLGEGELLLSELVVEAVERLEECFGKGVNIVGEGVRVRVSGSDFFLDGFLDVGFHHDVGAVDVFRFRRVDGFKHCRVALEVGKCWNEHRFTCLGWCFAP